MNRAHTSLLERNLPYSFASQLTENQRLLDSMNNSFVSQVTDSTAIVGMLAGGLVGRGLRVASFSLLGNLLGESRLAFNAARGGAFALGLMGESAAFTGTGRFIRGQGFEGFGHDFIHSAISLGALRVAGVASAGQSQILQRTINTSAVVAANQVAGILGVIDSPRENITDQFANALVMDIQSSFTRSLVDLGLPALGSWERSLDFAYESQLKGLQQLVGSEPLIRLKNPFSLRITSAMASLGTLILKSAEAAAQPLNAVSETTPLFQTITHGLVTTGFGVTGAMTGFFPGLFFPILKGKYKTFAALPILVGAAALAARLGTDFSSVRESVGNIAFLGSALATGLLHEAWLRRRIHDQDRIHLWQHKTPREQYVKTRPGTMSKEEYLALLDAPLEIDPKDASWSFEALSRDKQGNILRDPVDQLPLTFVRFKHDAPPKTAGFLKGNYLYNRVFEGSRVTAFVEGLMSALPMSGIYRKFNRVPGRTIRDFLVQKFAIAYPERFDWSALSQDSGSFGEFFTRPIVTAPEGLEVIPGQSFHDGVLDVVARVEDLDTGIRLAGKGALKKVWDPTKGVFVDVVGDAVLPLRQMLGRAANHFEGESLTVIATYLSPRHWHQTLSPVRGKILDIQSIEGKLQSVDPGVRQNISDPNFEGRPSSYFQSENSRVVVTIDTPEYGPVALICTAAALVSTSRVFRRVGDQVELGELLHEYRWGSHNTLVIPSRKVALAGGLVPGRQVYVRGTKPEGEDGIEWLFVPRDRLP